MVVKVWFQVSGLGLQGANSKLCVEFWGQSSISIRQGSYLSCFLRSFSDFVVVVVLVRRGFYALEGLNTTSF